MSDKKTLQLKDGAEVILRPLTLEDLDKSFLFFQTLPEEDRIFLRVDVTDRALVEERIRMIHRGHVERMIAIIDEDIVADGTLELEGHGWKEHVGELRLIVSRRFQRKGLGMLMARELYLLAVSRKLDEIMVRMMRPQKGAQAIFRTLGFHEEIVLPDYVKDTLGRKQDLIVMRCDLRAMWNQLEDYFEHHDWRRAR